MITCEELGDVTDQLCDLTRQMPGLDRVREASALLEQVEELPRRFAMQWRAASVADLHYLEGMSLRSIATAVGNAFQAVSQWLRSYGPSHYLLVRKIGGEPAELKVIKVEPKGTKNKIRTYRQAGFLPAPATLNLLDGENPVPGIDPETLWVELREPEVAA